MHSILPPSSASQWSMCYGWVELSLAFPELNVSTEAAMEGDASHQYAGRYIEKGVGVPIASEQTVGDFAENGVVLTEEMIEGAQMYIDDTLAIFADYMHAESNKCMFRVESQVSIASIHRECFGTPDSWLYDLEKNKLWIWDYKFGHVPVEVFQNKQLICYFAGIFTALSLRFGLSSLGGMEVEFRIVQPRAYHHKAGPVRSWVTKASDLNPALAELKAAANMSLSDDPHRPLNTGSHCRYCTYRGVCPAALTAGLSIYETAMTVASMDLSAPALGLQQMIVVRAMEQLKGLHTAYEELIKSRIKNGQTVAYWNVAPTKGSLSWVKPIKEVAVLGDLMGINLRKDKVATPTQAIKLGLDPAVVNQYAERPVSSKLVQESSDNASLIFSKGDHT